MRRSFGALALLLLILSGCTAAGYRAVQPADYARAQKIFDVTFGWNTTVADGDLFLEGYARNTRYFLMRDLTVTVSLIAADGAVQASEMVFTRPSELRIDELAQFSLGLKAVPQPGDILRFKYSYRASEDSSESLFWLNSFDVPAISN